MERKIGEIFEYNGEWYQCIVGNGCKNCAFYEIKCYNDNNDPIGDCCTLKRKDNKDVIFKKLEKVGGTYAHNSVTVQKYRIRATPVIMPNELYMYFNAIDNTIEIEIKQNKEDMSNTETLWYGPDKKEAKSLKLSNLKPFSLEAAKAGKPVCTRDGRKVRIICFDRKANMPIVALIECANHAETLQCVHNDGKCFHYDTSINDLMMLPEKKEGWVNVYKKEQNRYVKGIFPSREIALNSISEKSREYIATIKITWEE